MVARLVTEDEMVAAAFLKHRSTQGGGQGVKRWGKAPSPFIVPSKGWPTEAPPGTVEKLLVMIAREDRGEPLFHQFDARLDNDTLPLLYYLMKWEEREEKRLGKKERVR